MRGSGRGEVQWGVLLDDLGSADMMDSRGEAEAQYVALGGVGLIRVETATYLPPTTCDIDKGDDLGSADMMERPGWMSPGQYDPCPCLLPFAHEGGHKCRHDLTTPPGNSKSGSDLQQLGGDA
jgi:hypothetical protein